MKRASMKMDRLLMPIIVFAWMAIEADGAAAIPPNTEPRAGIQGGNLERHALVGGQIVTRPGKKLQAGTILIDGDLLRIVPADTRIPEGYRSWNLANRIVYPGFIDTYSKAEMSNLKDAGTRYWNRYIRPERDVSYSGLEDKSADESYRKIGMVARVVVPQDGILKGQSALMSTGDRPWSERMMVPRVAMHLRLTVPVNRDRDYYPNSPMGAVALARQTFLDADWY